MDELTPNHEGDGTHERELAGCRHTIEALRAASAYYRSLFEANPNALVTVGPTGTITDVNGAAEALFGFERQRFIGSEFTSRFTDPERVRRAFRQTQQQGSVRNRRLAVRQRGGHVVAVSCDTVVLKDERGRTVGTVATIRPVADRRYGADAQEQRNRRNQSILAAIGAGIYSVDLKGRCTFVNPAAERILGYDAEELLGRSPHETFHRSRPDGSTYPEADCPLHREHGSAVVGGSSDEYFQRKDGELFPIEYVRTPLLGDGWVDGVAVTFWDITERKRTEAALEEAKRSFAPSMNPTPLPWPSGNQTDASPKPMTPSLN